MAYLKIKQELTENFTTFKLTKISRGENATTDALASTSDPDLRRLIPVIAHKFSGLGIVNIYIFFKIDKWFNGIVVIVKMTIIGMGITDIGSIQVFRILGRSDRGIENPFFASVWFG